jgi:phosphogluconate dehydratase
VNQFQQSGGTAYVMQQLVEGGFVHDDVTTVYGDGLSAYTLTPRSR